MRRLFYGGYYKYLLLGLIFAASLFAFKPTAAERSTGSHIIFIEGSFSDALKLAKQKNKYVFVDAYASWCGPCKILKAKTFADAKAAAFFNANFINVSIDMEKGEGPDLATQWGLQAYPTLIIFDPNGKPVLGSVGLIGASDLIRFGKQALGNQQK
jgi:thioredoxin 1